MQHYLGDIYAITTALFWAVAVIFFKLSEKYLKAVPLKVFHNVLTVGLLFGSATLLQEPLTLEMSASDWLRVAASAIIGITLGDTFYMAALHRVGAGLQAVVDGLYTPFVMFLAFAWFKETVSPQIILGAALVIGSIFLAQVGMRRSARSPRDYTVGLVYAVLSQMAMAACVVMVKDLLPRFPLLTLTAYRFLIGTVFLVAYYELKPNSKESLWQGFRPSAAWRVTLPGVILGPFLATILWFAGFKYTLAGKAAVYNQLSTVLIIGLAALFLGERLTRYRVAALILAGFGGWLVLNS